MCSSDLNFRIVNGTAVYTAAFTPPAAPLTAITNTSLLTCQSNRFIDNSTNAFAITVNGSPSVQAFQPFPGATTWSGAVLGGSGYFDGSGDYLTAASNAAFGYGTGDFTIEFWYYPTSFAASAIPIILDQRTSGATEVVPTIITNTSGLLQYYVNGATRITGSTLTTNQWYHIAICRSGTSTKMFLNGVQDGSTYSDSNNYATSLVSLGAYSPSPTGYYIFGYIGGVRITKGGALYTTTFTPPTAPLTTTVSAGTVSLLLSCTNAGIFDTAAMNDLETVGNAQVSTSVVKYGTGSMYFNGSGSWLLGQNTPTANLGSGSFTIECWINFSASVSGTGYAIVTKAPSAFTPQASFAFWRSTTNKLRFIFSTDGGATNLGQIDTTSDFLPLTGTWYHIAVTRSGSTFYLFINGTSQAVTTSFYGSATSSSAIGDTTTPLYVGAFSDGTYLFNGYIDDLRITKGAARYIGNFTPPIARMPGE